jgi:signal transduction histidine kinase
MTLQRKLALFLLAASLVPVAGLAFPILAWSQREIGRRAEGEHLARAEATAARVAADLAAMGLSPADLVSGAIASDATALAAVRRRLLEATPSGGSAYAGALGGPVFATAGAGSLGDAQRAEIAARLDPAAPGALTGQRVLAAWAPLGGGAGVLVAVPAEVAYADVIRLRRGTLLGCAALAAVVLAGSFFVSRRTTAGLARIGAAARALGAGDLSARLLTDGRDELAEVSRTFNLMAEELQASRAKLERWNEDLKKEVEARAAELREAQAQLVEAQKLAAIGQLGAGVAHELNNPLTGVLGNAQLLLETLPARHPDREALEKIETLARRCRDITQKLLRFSQQSAAPDFREVELNRVVADALSLAEGNVKAAGIPMDVLLDERAPRVRGDPGHLAQVVLSLVSNARTACLQKAGAGIRVSTRAENGEVELEVQDGGKGIPSEHLPRIFEPFFTTKDHWSDVGLGLSVSYRIVAEHGGRIQVASRIGEGSTFTVRLPAARAASA